MRILMLLLLADVSLGAGTVWNAFAGRESVLVRGLPGLQAGEQVWFRVAKEHRTLTSGTVRAGPGGVAALPASLPEMKAGVALPLQLELRAGAEQGRVLRASETVWAFAEQPFDPGHNPAAPRSIWLYDPAGRTAAAFKSIALPFETANRMDLLADLTNAVVVVAEDVSLEAERGLWEVLTAAVARGNGVLLLAPSDGMLRPPDGWSRLMAGDAGLLRHPVGGGSAYELDLTDWPPDGTAVRRRFRMEGWRESAVFTATADTGCTAVGWSKSGGRFRACGLGLIAKWEQTPAARWLLVEMLAGLGQP